MNKPANFDIVLSINNFVGLKMVYSFHKNVSKKSGTKQCTRVSTICSTRISNQ